MNLEARCPHGILMTRTINEDQSDSSHCVEMSFVSELTEEEYGWRKNCGCYFSLKIYPGLKDTIFMGERKLLDD